MLTSLLRSGFSPRPDTAPAASPRRISLALQGGGAFGAFTWGVLDRLLEEDDLDLDAVSGASAGALNGVLLAEGLRRDGRAGARALLESFWTRLGRDTAASFLPNTAARAGLALDLSTRLLSPYQLNPFNLNPLRAMLEDAVDFDALRRESPVRLMISATRVGDGSMRLFRETEVTSDVVLASACLPLLHQAVTIDGESYWDGGYAANPPLLPLVEDSETRRILLVQIVPTSGDDHPITSPGIVNRLNQITFNTGLQRDLEAIAALQRLSREEHGTGPQARKLRDLTVDHVSAEDWYPDLMHKSAGNLNRSFVQGLRDSGRAAAAAWLGADGGEDARPA